MLAIIDFGGHQHIVQSGQELVVDLVEGEEGSTIAITSVLCTFDAEGGKVSVGEPFVSGAAVSAKIVSHQQGEKMHVGKIQNKKRYRRRIGFRPQQTILLIEKITA